MTASSTWLKKAVPEIFDTLSLSERGSIPPFPLEEVVSTLKESLGLEDLSVNIEKMDFIDGDIFFEGLGRKTLSIPLVLSPLKGLFYLVMGVKDVQTLISCMEKGIEDSTKILVENESIVKGLYTYFITEAIDSIMQKKVYADLNLKISEGTIKEFSAYGIDLSIQVKGNYLPARILIPETFYKEIHSHFTFIPPTLENLENIPDINVPVTVRTGSIDLNQDELSSLENGDYLILHNSFYKPSEKKGSFQMLIGDQPIFQTKMQKDGIKVLDYLYFYNEENMDENELDSPLGENFEHEVSLDDTAEDIVDDLDIDDEGEGEGFHQDSLLAPEKTRLSGVSLTMNMEIARFSLSLEELKKITPGYKLPIKINPRHVNLVISGKSVGTGEIIEIGDTIGVKVTELYK
jgi:type III secretion system YscQ/HrcQ family protein